MTAWDSVDDAKDFYDLFSELMRTKRYREHFEQDEFPEDTKIRILPVTTNAPGASAPVRLRFRIADKRVVVAISNAADTLRKLEGAEDSLIAASLDKP